MSVKTSRTKSLHVSRRAEIMRRDFVVQNLIFSMPRGLGSESPSSVPTGFHVQGLLRLGAMRQRRQLPPDGVS